MKKEKDTASGLLLRPARHAEHRLVTSVLDGTYLPGTALPNERSLALDLGVTRPTLRETLQRLALEGWLTIRHGKPTVVNDYWDCGGMALLGTLSEYVEYLPADFFIRLLEVRANLLPGIARLAAGKAPGAIQAYLETSGALPDEAAAYSRYDWGLQALMAKRSGNPVYTLLLNDFEALFETLALRYFGLPEARKVSGRFYRDLRGAVAGRGRSVEAVVRAAMERSIVIYAELNEA
jgi:GntR family negative regulator for fad regulon and positive regulator of fabA